MTYISEKKVFGIDFTKTLTNTGVLRLLETASLHLGEINNIVSNVLEFDFIVTALKNIEALNSARIEGTTGNLKDLYLEDALDFEKKKQLKLFSAINYKMTVDELENIVKKYRKIDLILIRHLHKLLTENDPATTGQAGNFRKKEVIIRNSKLGDFYPTHPLKVDEFMERFSKEIDQRNDYPTLLQTAILHYQFEAIHPFEDGNGRTGRLLILTNILMRDTLDCAVLNLSQYFDTHRDDYLASLRSVSDKENYEEWIEFFLRAIVEQCQHNLKLIENLRSIKEEDILLLNENTYSASTQSVLNYSLNKLFITVPNTSEYLKARKIKGDVKQMARNSIKKLLNLGILEKTAFKIGKTEVYQHAKLRKMLK